MISTNEGDSPRFERLVELLLGGGDDIDLEECFRVRGHLQAWYEKWSGHGETDSGLLWGVTESRMGRWAQWPQPLKFGRALVAAGYVVSVERLYPSELLKGRDGFVVVGFEGGVALDTSWPAIHRSRADALDLVLFLTDPRRRIKQMMKFQDEDRVNWAAVAEDGLMPAAWLEDIRSGTDATLNNDVDRSGDNSALNNVVDYTLGLRGDLPGDPLGGPPGGPPGDPLSTVNRNRKRRDVNLRNTVTVPESGRCGPPAYGNGTGGTEGRNGREGTEGWKGGNGQNRRNGTAEPKSHDMLWTIREFKHEDPLKALQAVDGTGKAMSFWRKAIAKDRAYVSQQLSEVTETERIWAGLKNPAAVLTKRLTKGLKL